MRRATASLAFALVLGASLTAKALILEHSHAATSEDPTEELVAFLEQRGFETMVPNRAAEPVWVVGRREGCRVSIANVSPQGWHRTAVAEQAAGQRLRFAFDGELHRDQPVERTKVEDYRRRLVRYLGFSVPEPAVRAVVLGPHCPEETVGPREAELLSK